MRLHPNVRRELRHLVVIGVFMALAAVVAFHIVREQRLRFPWEDRLQISAEFTSAQAVTPGQGQSVNIAGVKVGEIGRVELKDGRALVRMDIEEDRAGPVYANARLLLRPKTGLADMSIQMEPGTPDPDRPAAGRLRDGDVIPSAQTAPHVNPDEVFAGLDADVRRYLAILVNAGGEGLAGNGERLRALFEASRPTLADTAKVTEALADRRAKLRRVVSNLRRIGAATAGKDRKLASLVRSTAVVADTVGAREARLGEAAERLPGAVGATRRALAEVKPLAEELGPAAEELRPMARELAPALRAVRPLLADATPVVRDHVRPLVREAVPLLEDLNPAVADVNRTFDPLVAVAKDAHYVVNEVLYNPPGPEEGYLFWAAWFIHNASSILTVEDAHGAIWRGLAMVGCSTAATAIAANPALAPIGEAPVCPEQKAAIARATRRAKARVARAARAEGLRIAQVRAGGGQLAGARAGRRATTEARP